MKGWKPLSTTSPEDETKVLTRERMEKAYRLIRAQEALNKKQYLTMIVHPVIREWLEEENNEMEDIEEQVFNTLQGKYKHYCWDWDGMAIDETCPEFEYCLCYDAAEVKELKDKLSSGGLEGT